MNSEEILLQRCNAACELCSADAGLAVYEVPPVDQPEVESSIMICNLCRAQINDAASMDANHWRCLNDSMWSSVPAVQVMAWRLLKRLCAESWAQDLLDMLYLDEAHQQWAEAAVDDSSDDHDRQPTLDSNGSALENGDSVTLIKDLVVKGANFTAKRGTTVRNIALTSNPEQIEGRVNGMRIVLLSCFLKRSN
ncbi:MAG: PhnA domain protein [Gammaproteobacteria bacterium]|nr:PhnA domain protein [Gammaproteobacteria bacterium]